jgi:peptidoglycan/LPS O-acetylase OafA/YrhL
MDIAGATSSTTSPPASLPTSINAERRERLHYIQAMRATAIIIVVATHCRDPFLENTFIRSDEAGVLFRHINVVFIYISGFLFQFLLGRFTYYRYLHTKLINVIVPYLVWSVPAIAAYLIGIKSLNGLEAPIWFDSTPKLVLFMLATGTHMAPFWFIPMMAIIYIVSPILVRMDRTPWGYLAIAPLLLISVLVGRSVHDANPMKNFLFYVPVYVIGMAVSHYREQVIPQLSRYFPVLLIAIILPLVAIALDPWLDNVEFITKILFCLGLTGLCARFSRNIPSWVNYLGNISFGIYFVHYYIVAMLNIAAKSVLNGFFSGSIIAYSVTVIAVLVPSIATVTIAKKVMGRYSRMFIGA